MSKTKERLLQEYTAASREFHRTREQCEDAHQEFRKLLKASDAANDRLTKARAAVLERMMDGKAPQVGQPGGPFGPPVLHSPHGQVAHSEKADQG